MRKVLLVFGIVLMTVSSCDCGCENRMNVLLILLFSMEYTPVNIDLPKPSHSASESPSMEVGIVSKDRYYINLADDQFYTADEIMDVLSSVAEKDSIHSIKFSIAKDVTYESVFELINFCKENNLKIILKYRNVN